MDDDDELLARLDEVLARTDPDDPIAIELGEAAFDMRGLDAELARLVADSSELAPAAVRSGEHPRLVTFAGPSLTIELEIDGRRIAGQLEPATRAEVTIRNARGDDVRVDADAHGGFVAETVPSGPVALLVRTAQGQVHETAWLTL